MYGGGTSPEPSLLAHAISTGDPGHKVKKSPYGVSTQKLYSGLVAHENSTFRNLAIAVSVPFLCLIRL